MKTADKITRDDEKALPKFRSYEEAHSYFEDKYGELFQTSGTEIIDNRRCYFYYLILDKEVFLNGQKELREKGFLSGIEYLESHQPVEIWDNGDIHIIH